MTHYLVRDSKHTKTRKLQNYYYGKIDSNNENQQLESSAAEIKTVQSS